MSIRPRFFILIVITTLVAGGGQSASELATKAYLTSPDGTPLPGERVYLARESGGHLLEAIGGPIVTDDQGGFNLPAVPDGRGKVVVTDRPIAAVVQGGDLRKAGSGESTSAARLLREEGVDLPSPQEVMVSRPLPRPFDDLVSLDADTRAMLERPTVDLPVLGIDPRVVFHVNGRSYTWVAQVPFPVDVNNDLVIDGTLFAGINFAAGIANPLVCFSSDLAAAGLFPLRGEIGVTYAQRSLRLITDVFPARADACGRSDASGVISNVSLITSPRTAAPFTARILGNGQELRVVFNSSPGSVAVRAEGETFNVLRMSYSADASYDVDVEYSGFVYARAELRTVPTSMTLRFERVQFPTYSRLFADYSATSVMGSITALMQPARNSPDFLLVYLRDIPTRLIERVLIEGDGQTLTEASLVHTASGRLGEVFVRGRYGGFDGFIDLYNIPDWVTFDYAQLGSSAHRPTPVLTYSASSGGLTALVYARGTALAGGYVDVRISNLPPAFSTTFIDRQAWEREAIVLSTMGTGPLNFLYADVDLPGLIVGPITKVTAFLSGLEHLEIRQKDVINPWCMGCQYWTNRQVDRFWFVHGAIQFGALDLDIYWKAEECAGYHDLATCDSQGLWVVKYHVTTKNVMDHYPPFLTPGAHVRTSQWIPT